MLFNLKLLYFSLVLFFLFHRNIPKMKKIWMIILSFALIAGIFTFILVNNQAYCADNTSCSTSQLSQTWTIIPYTDTALQEAIYKGDKIGFLFEAARCANCKLLKEYLLAKWIPSWSTLLIVDFDQAQELRTKYWVKNLHTFIRIDQDLNLISKDESGEYEKIITLFE